MAVDDHGLEVLKKAGEEINSGDKSDYYIKVGGVGSIISGIVFDDVELTASTATTETYTYRNSGNDLIGVLVTFSDSTKDCVIRLQQVSP